VASTCAKALEVFEYGFRRKTAVVTGSARGIGRGIALELAARGSNVVIADMDEESAREVVAEIKAGGTRSYYCETDVTQQWLTDDMVEAALEEYGQLDVLVNNAGVGGSSGFTTRKTPLVEDWQATFDVNVYGIVKGTQSVEKYMVDRGYGKIVNISSISGRPGFASYAASKAAAIRVAGVGVQACSARHKRQHGVPRPNLDAAVAGYCEVEKIYRRAKRWINAPTDFPANSYRFGAAGTRTDPR
jgi:NADP-dependent 3-hydroxy acid dehydrogenase YdfG